MEENKTNSGGTDGLDNAMNTLDEKVSMVVGKIYNEAFVSKIENLDFMKKLAASNFIKAINDFGKGWFKQVFVILGYLSIISGAFLFVTGVISLFKIFSTHRYWVLLYIANLLMAILYLVGGVGMVKFKKWYPFVTILTVGVSIGIQILSAFALKIIWGSTYYGGAISVAYGSMFTAIAIGLALWVITYALIMKNKALFKN